MLAHTTVHILVCVATFTIPVNLMFFTHNFSLEGTMELKFGPFFSS